MADPQSQPIQSTQAPGPQTVNPTVLGRSTDPVRPSDTTRIDVTPPTQTGQTPPPVQFGGGNDVDREHIIKEEKVRIETDIVNPITDEFEKLKEPLKRKGSMMGDSGIYMPAPGDFLSPSSLKGPDALDLEQEMRHVLYNMGNYLPTITATPINIPGGDLVTKFQEWFDDASRKFTENARAVADAEYQAAVGQQRALYNYQMHEYSKAIEEHKKARDIQTLLFLSDAAERGSPGAEMQLERFLEDKTLTVEDLTAQPASAGMRAQAVPDNASVARMMSSDGSKLLQITLAPKSSGGGTSIDATPTMQTMAQNTVGSAVEQLQKAFQNPAQQQAIENWNQMVGNKVTKSDVIIDPNSPGAYQTYLKESGVEKQLFQEAQRTTINPGAYLPGWVYDAQIQGKTAIQQNAPVAPLQDFGTIFTPQAYQERFDTYAKTHGTKALSDFLGGGSFESAAKFMGEGKSVGLEPSSRSVVHINDEPFFYTSYGSSGYELRDMTGQIRSAGSGDIPADVLEREMNKIKTQVSPKVISPTLNTIYKDIIDTYAPKTEAPKPQSQLTIEVKQPSVLNDKLVDFGDIFTTEAYKARFDNYTRKPNTMDISQFIDGSTASAAKFMGEGQNVGRTPTARNLFYVNDDPYFYTSYGKDGYEVRDVRGQIRSAGSGDVPLDAIERELEKLKDTKQSSVTSLTANAIFKDVSDKYAVEKPVATSQQSITPGILSVDAPDFGDIFTTGAYKDRFDRYVRKPNTMDISQFIDGSTFSAAQFMGEGQNVGRTPDVRKVLYINDEPYFYSGYGKNGYEVRDARGQIRSAGSGNVPVDAIERELEKLKDTKQSSLTSITTNEIYKDIGDVYNIKKPAQQPSVTPVGTVSLEGADFGNIFTVGGYKDRFDNYVRKPGTMDISQFIDGSTASAALFMGEGQNVGRIPEVRKVMYINDEPYFYSGYGKHGYEVRDARGQIRSAGTGDIPIDAVQREIEKLADTKQSSLISPSLNLMYKDVIDKYAIPKPELSGKDETSASKSSPLEGTDFGGIFSPGMYKSRFDRYARGGSKPGTLDIGEFIDGSTFSAALFMGEGQNVGRIPEVRKVMYINDEPYFYSGYGKHGYEVRDVRGQIRSAGAGNIPIDAVQREIEKLADTKQSSLISPTLNLMYKDEIKKYTIQPPTVDASSDIPVETDRVEPTLDDVVVDTPSPKPEAVKVTIPVVPSITLPGIADIIAGEQDRREGKTKTVETRDTPTAVISEYDRLFRPEYAIQVGYGALTEMERQGIDTPEKAQRALGISNQILGLLPQQSSMSGGPSGSAVSKAALYQGTDFGNIFTPEGYKGRFDAYQAKPGTMELNKFIDGSTDAAAQFMGEGQNVGRTPSVRKVMYVNGEPYFYSGYGKYGYEVRDARGQIRSAGSGDIPVEYVEREIAKLADTKQSSVISPTANLINRDIINKYVGGEKSNTEVMRDNLLAFNDSLKDIIPTSTTFPGVVAGVGFSLKTSDHSAPPTDIEQGIVRLVKNADGTGWDTEKVNNRVLVSYQNDTSPGGDNFSDQILQDRPYIGTPLDSPVGRFVLDILEDRGRVAQSERESAKAYEQYEKQFMSAKDAGLIVDDEFLVTDKATQNQYNELIIAADAANKFSTEFETLRKSELFGIPYQFGETEKDLSKTLNLPDLTKDQSRIIVQIHELMGGSPQLSPEISEFKAGVLSGAYKGVQEKPLTGIASFATGVVGGGLIKGVSKAPVVGKALYPILKIGEGAWVGSIGARTGISGASDGMFAAGETFGGILTTEAAPAMAGGALGVRLATPKTKILPENIKIWAGDVPEPGYVKAGGWREPSEEVLLEAEAMRAASAAKPDIKTARSISSPSPKKVKSTGYTRIKHDAAEQYYLERYGDNVKEWWSRPISEKYLSQEDIAEAYKFPTRASREFTRLSELKISGQSKPIVIDESVGSGIPFVKRGTKILPENIKIWAGDVPEPGYVKAGGWREPSEEVLLEAEAMRAASAAKPDIKTARSISSPSPQKIKAIENTRLRREEMDMLALEQYYLNKFGKDIGGWRRSTPEKYLAQEDIANAPTTIAGGFHQSANPLHSIPIAKYYAGLGLPIRAPKLLSRNYRQPSRGYQTTPSIDQRVGSNQNKIYDSTRHKVGKKMRQYPNNIHGATVGVGAVPGITSSNDYLQNTSVNDSNTIQSIVNQMRGANGYTTSLPIFMMTYPLTQSAQYALEDDEEYLRLRPKDESKDLTALRSSNYLKRPRDALPISQLPFDWLETSKDESRNDNSSEVIRDSKRLNIRVGQVQPKVISKPMVRSDVMSAIAKDIRQDTRQDVLQGIDVSQSIRSTQDIMQNVRQETRQKLREDTKLKSQPTLRSKPIRRGERIIRIRQQPKVVKFKVPGLLELPDGQKMKKSRGKSSIKTTRTVWDIASPDAVYFGGTKRKRRGDDLITAPIKQIGITNIKLPVTKLKNMKS